MYRKAFKLWQACRAKPWWFGLAAIIVPILFAGCAHSSGAEARYHVMIRNLRPPQLPGFLSGPMVVCLTNEHGFGGHVTIETLSFSNRLELVAGELVGRNGKFVFVPEAKAQAKKRAPEDLHGFIWDSTANKGLILNEALQGYAPVSSEEHFTNILVKTAKDYFPAVTVDGHRCRQEEATVYSSHGSEAHFHIWRAEDLNGFPIRITTSTNATSVILIFTRVRLETPPLKLFQPPDGFAKYDSGEAMLNELLERQANTRRRPNEEADHFDRTGQDNRSNGYGR